MRLLTASLCGLCVSFITGRFLTYNPQINQTAIVAHGTPLSWVLVLGFGAFVSFYLLLSKVK